MPKKVRLSRFFLSLVTTSFLTEIATTIWVLPSQAASIAFSQLSTELTNFSYKPYTTQTFTDTTTLAIALTNSSSSSIAQAEANFFVEPTLTTSEILSIATGEGSDYFSSAQSQAQIIGDFTINASEIFSFDFQAAVNALTLTNNLSSNESASASGNLSFLLVDTFAPSLVYDSFLLSFNLGLPISNNPLSLQTSDNFLIESITSSNNFESTKNVTSALLQGSFIHQFEDLTNITLIQDTNNQVSVAVPEPEALLGSLFFVGLIGIKYKNKKRHSCLSQNYDK